ncbi:hypothetical protein HHK36_028236 [Tetracentron sinense]|uniref:Uncharacterized protein n=1 Tax=Tetracentron sinense TaxID=13715 RepID=A0A834YJL1_TETSI|nr:hypothetical protein HHK36_028236 [Tetracentron sinense]
MARSTTKDAQALFHSLRSAYTTTPTNLKVSLSFSLYYLKESENRIPNPIRILADHRSLRDFCDRHSSDSAC